MPQPLRVAKILQEKLTQRPGTLLPADSQIETICDACHTKQTLYECRLEVDETDATLYH